MKLNGINLVVDSFSSFMQSIIGLFTILSTDSDIGSSVDKPV